MAWRAWANLDWNGEVVVLGWFVRVRRDSEMLLVGSGWAGRGLNLVTLLCVISLLSPSSYAME